MNLLKILPFIPIVFSACENDSPSMHSYNQVKNSSSSMVSVVLWRNTSLGLRQMENAVLFPGDSCQYGDYSLDDAYGFNGRVDTVYYNKPFDDVDSITFYFPNSITIGFSKDKFDKFSPFVYANCQVYKLSAFEYMFQYIITDELRSESEKTVEH